MVKIGVNLLKL